MTTDQLKQFKRLLWWGAIFGCVTMLCNVVILLVYIGVLKFH